jgi:ribonuclease P protein component
MSLVLEMHTFSKNERLCSRVLIEHLVKSGKSFNQFPLKITWLPIQESSSPVKIVISVPKRLFKKAVDRNKLKRQIREIYRHEKQNFYQTIGDKKFLLLLTYTAKTKIEFRELEKEIKKGLVRLAALMS